MTIGQAGAAALRIGRRKTDLGLTKSTRLAEQRQTCQQRQRAEHFAREIRRCRLLSHLATTLYNMAAQNARHRTVLSQLAGHGNTKPRQSPSSPNAKLEENSGRIHLSRTRSTTHRSPQRTIGRLPRRAESSVRLPLLIMADAQTAGEAAAQTAGGQGRGVWRSACFWPVGWDKRVSTAPAQFRDWWAGIARSELSAAFTSTSADAAHPWPSAWPLWMHWPRSFPATKSGSIGPMT